MDVHAQPYSHYTENSGYVAGDVKSLSYLVQWHDVVTAMCSTAMGCGISHDILHNIIFCSNS